MDCKGFTERMRTTLTTEMTHNSINMTTMNSTIVFENYRPMIGIIVFIILAVIIIVIISVVLFLIYWFSREKHSEKDFSTVMSSQNITSTKTTEKNLSTIGSETTEKSIEVNENQLSTINTEKSLL
jgi:flagellar basal body-associated protein FliL